MKICSKCQTACEDNMKFCLNCGAPFPVEEVKVEEPVEVVIEDQKPEVKPEPALEPVFSAAEIPDEPAKEINVDDIEIKEFVPTPEPAPFVATAPVEEEKPSKKKKPVYDDEDEDDEDDDYDDDDYDDDYYEDDGVKKPISPVSVIALICAIIGLFSCGYGAVLSFINLGIGMGFYGPAVLGIIFGIIAACTTGRGHKRSGKAMAVISVILAIAAVIFWTVCIFILKGQTMSLYGSSDIISVVRLIFER